MQLSITGKGMDIGAALQEYVENMLPPAVTKYFDNTTDAQVTFHKEAHEFRADITVHVSRPVYVQGSGKGGDAHSAFDEALEHVSKRLRRNKRKLRDQKHRGDEDSLPALQYVIAPEPDLAEGEETDNENTDPVIVAEMPESIDTLSVSEAVMRMDLSGQNALMFRSSKHGGLNMVYQRDDGNVGWVDPNTTSDS